MDFTERRQRIPLDFAMNVRELGGLPTNNGGVTRWQQFLRSDNVAQLPLQDIKSLKEYGVKTVIDLRSKEEVEEIPNIFKTVSDVNYYPLPLLTKMPSKEGFMGYKPSEFSLALLYVYILDECQENLYNVMKTIANNLEGVTLYHCTAGKDRTGVISAFLLLLAEVGFTDIVANYETSATFIKPIADRVAGGEKERKNMANVLGSHPKEITKFLFHLEEKYGGARRYLENIGLTITELDRIQDRFSVNLK